MLIIFEKIRKIEQKLANLKETGKIIDYRLILKLNMTVNLYVVTDGIADVEIESLIPKENISIDVEKISEREFKSDEYYSLLFDKTKPLDFGLRRSLSNIIEYNDDIELTSCPIVSFYSYKGGVGRTTALALFASHYAMHQGKKVFIIDCDFEAPGLINFYGIRNEELPKSGIVEYIQDKEVNSDIQLRDNYVYEISRRYSGDGEIYLLPAGNIFDDVDTNDYLEALARLDIHGTSTIAEQFKNVITEINREYHPDVILIDSRTGFNDVFGIISNKLSHIVVGFFGNNTQNKPGLHFFLKTLLKKKRPVNLLLVLSIVSKSYKELKLFQNEIEEYIQSNIGADEALASLPAFPILSLSRQERLEEIGTENEDVENFIDIIERKRFGDYEEFFEKLEQQIVNFLFSEPEIVDSSLKKSDNDKASDLKKPDQLKKIVIKKLAQNFPESYAENIVFSDSFLNAAFYFRRCMEDIFNPDQFLLLGSKGTGKTAFYRALRQENFFERLKRKAQKQYFKCQVISVISLKEDPEKEKNKFFEITCFSQPEIRDPEYFYRRFWIAYIWNAIRLDDLRTGFKSQSKLQVQPLFSDNETAKYFKNYILEDNVFSEIEKDLYEFDHFLKTNSRYAMIIFDQLDRVVKPNLWANAISPLVRYCQTHNFKRILPKLFVRRDLFKKLSNLTNKQSLENQAIDLEWTKDELYAFFFKIIFAHAKEEFFEYILSIKTMHEEKLNEIKQKLEQPYSYNQISPEESFLRPLVETFFGKYFDPKGTSNYGEMYEWIYRNLKNADKTINLRPFLDLIKYAIEIQYKKPGLNEGIFPILSPKCFTADVREDAVARYFDDLASEEGNEALRIIIDDIKNNRVPQELKVLSLLENDFEKMLKNIIERHEELKNKSFLDLEDILKLNGIIFVRYMARGKKKYSFAYLYKYYLGLRT